jgi:hypothetical protein
MSPEMGTNSGFSAKYKDTNHFLGLEIFSTTKGTPRRSFAHSKRYTKPKLCSQQKVHQAEALLKTKGTPDRSLAHKKLYTRPTLCLQQKVKQAEALLTTKSTSGRSFARNKVSRTVRSA